MTGSRRVHHDPKTASVLARVEAQYAATRERLAGDEEYERLRAAAETEADRTPAFWVNRNRLALYVETQTPMTAGNLEPSPDRVGVLPYLAITPGIVPVVLLVSYIWNGTP